MPIPIPQRPSGYRLGSSDALQIEMFFDLECPFSKKGWQTILKVVEAYTLEQIYLILQPMTLGNHRQSWDATKAAISQLQDKILTGLLILLTIFLSIKKNLLTKHLKTQPKLNGIKHWRNMQWMQPNGQTKISLLSF